MTAGAPKAFAGALSSGSDWRKAAREAARSAREGLRGKPCHAALFFVSEGYKGLIPEELQKLLSDELGRPALIGCNSSGIIGSEREIEMEPALSLLAMYLPGVRVEGFTLSAKDVARFEKGSELVKEFDVYPTEKPKFLCLADPSSCDIERLLELFNEGYQGAPVIGGLASGMAVGRPNWLAGAGGLSNSGAVGLALSRGIEVEVLVSQGCRPIGTRFIITKADRNVLYELASRPALEVLREVVGALPAEDRELARHSLFAGLVMDERRAKFSRGDFLVRNLMGLEPDSGALVLGTALRPGQTLQFQLRDAKTSAEDLRALLESRPAAGPAGRGALLVSCCGRGQGLYGKPNHDVALIQELRGPLPLAGFFANGEIGPVGEKNFIHGYTSSLAIIS